MKSKGNIFPIVCFVFLYALCWGEQTLTIREFDGVSVTNTLYSHTWNNQQRVPVNYTSGNVYGAQGDYIMLQLDQGVLRDGDGLAFPVYKITEVGPASPPAGPDINEDNCVNLLDVVEVANYWMFSSCSSPLWCDGADIDGSGDVGIGDLMKIADKWLNCPKMKYESWVDRITLMPPQMPTISYKSVNITTISQGWGTLQVDQSVRETPLKIKNTTYEKGLGTHSIATLRVTLSEPAQTFYAEVGIDNNWDTSANPFWPSVQFSVKDGSTILAQTPICRYGNDPRILQADISGLQTFDIYVSDGGDGISWDQADLGNAKVIFADGTELFIPGQNTLVENDFLDSSLLPFSFVYGDQFSDTLLPTWNRSVQITQEAGGERRLITWQDPLTALRVYWTVLVYKDYPAMEMGLEFENCGPTPAPVLRSVQVPRQYGLAPVELVYGNGGASEYPDNFRPHHETLNSSGQQITLAASNGWSSCVSLPFWLLANPDGWGLYYGLGWTGQWAASFSVLSNGGISLAAGMQNLNLRLESGERISQPNVLIGYFDGDATTGHNALRKILYEQYTPVLGGQKPLPPVSWNHWFTFANGITESLLTQMAGTVAPLGLEYFCVDAGWFYHDFSSVGDWRVNPTKFPNGLEPVAQAVQANGMKMGLWFEPERVHSLAYDAFEHKEWLLPTPDPANWMVDLSIPAAQQWVIDLIGGYVQSLNLKWIRYDNNYPPGLVWNLVNQANPERAGLKEIRYIEGLYHVLETLNQQYPDLCIEWCAGGGRRIDLETIRKSHTFWKSDITGDGDVTRPHLTGGNVFIPGNYLNSNLMNPLSTRYDYYCQFGGPLGFGKDFRQFNSSQLAVAAGYISSFKQIRQFLIKDYYPLFGDYPTAQTEWDGWQFHDPQTDKGFFLLFRLSQSPDAYKTVKLHGLTANKIYTLTPDQMSNLPSTATGQTLMDGVSVNIAAPRNVLLVRYE